MTPRSTNARRAGGYTAVLAVLALLLSLAAPAAAQVVGGGGVVPGGGGIAGGGSISGPLGIVDGTTCTAPAIYFNSEPTTGVTRAAASQLAVCVSGTQVATFQSTGLNLASTYTLNWNGDTKLTRLAANRAGMQNGATAQEWDVFNNANEYLRFTWSSNVALIDTVTGAGSDRDLRLSVPTGRTVKLAVNGTDVCSTSSTQFTCTGIILAGSGSEFRFPSSSRIQDVNDGIIQFRNSAGTSIIRAVFGANDGTSNGFSLTMNGGKIDVKSGDGTAYTGLQAQNLIAVGGALIGTGTVAAAGDVRLENNTDVRARNATNSADIVLVGTDTSNFVNIGGSGAAGLKTVNAWKTLNNVATAGTFGVSPVVAYGDVVAATNTGTASIATFTPGSDGTYNVGCNILITTSTTHSFSCDVTYTDEGNTARTMVLPVVQLAGTFVTTGLITNVTGAGPYESPQMTVRAKSGTAITVRTSAGGTYTNVVYNARGFIKGVSN